MATLRIRIIKMIIRILLIIKETDFFFFTATGPSPSELVFLVL